MEVDSAVTVIAALLVVLVVSRLAGVGARRLGQPAVVGALLAGMALAVVGAAGLPQVEVLKQSAAVHAAANVGMFAVLLGAGMEIAPSGLARSFRQGAAVATGGALLPLATGIVFAFLFFPEGEDWLSLGFVFGVALSITAIPSTVKVLGELRLMHSRMGSTVVAAALIDDVIGMVLVAIMAALAGRSGTDGWSEIARLLAGLVLFVGVTTALGTHVYPRIRAHIRALDLAAAELFTLCAVALAYGLFAELMGLHWVLGPVMAAIYFEPDRVGSKAYNEVRLALGGLSDGLVAPIFFCAIGLEFDPSAVIGSPGLIVLAVFVAVFGKLAGAGLPARSCGLSGRAAVAVGIAMSARGAVELVVLSVAVEAGLLRPQSDTFHADLYSTLIVTAVLTTLIAPLALRWWLRDYRPSRGAGQPPGEKDADLEDDERIFPEPG